MQFKRSAGILLHPTSLPGKFGIGDLGSEAYKFIDFLKEAGQTLMANISTWSDWIW
jgi:4-alpha-glucanotransferase